MHRGVSAAKTSVALATLLIPRVTATAVFPPARLMSGYARTQRYGGKREVTGGANPTYAFRWQASLRPGQEISEVDELLVLHGVDDFRHLRVIAAARIVLVAAQRLEQVILALAGQARHVLLPLISRLVTEIAAMLVGEHARPFH